MAGKNVDVVPVVIDSRLVGIFPERDLLTRVAAASIAIGDSDPNAPPLTVAQSLLVTMEIGPLARLLHNRPHRMLNLPAPNDRQKHLRRSVLVSGRLWVGDISIECEVLNFSEGGAKVRLSRPFDAMPRVALEVEGLGRIEGAVSWLNDADMGLSFADSPADLDGFLTRKWADAPNAEERRRFPRCWVLWAGHIVSADQSVDCVILNLSASGAKVRLYEPVAMSERLTLTIRRYGDFQCRLVWQNDAEFGVAFADPPRHIVDILGDALPRVRVDLDDPRGRSDPA